jgi:cytochrome c oxidase cbb3-type subunit III
MALADRDPYTGHMTTGHEWNGITELNTRVPRPVYGFFALAFLFAVVCWILLPAWPTGRTYTRGLLDTDQRKAVAAAVAETERVRAAWMSRVAKESFAEVAADRALMEKVREAGHSLFGNNCAACHGADARGNPSFPNLRRKSWLWGGEPETLAETIRVGINAENPESRQSQMPAFGRDGMLKPEEIQQVVAYVGSLPGPGAGGATAADIAAGKELFAANCASCHGEDGKGNHDMGSRNLTDGSFLYGSDPASLYRTVFGGRQGHMPSWAARLTPVEIKVLALYVTDLRP